MFTMSVRVKINAALIYQMRCHLVGCASQDRARIVFDCRMLNDAATIKDSTNENNTDVDCWADTHRLRINGKPCSKQWRCLNLRGTPCRSR